MKCSLVLVFALVGVSVVLSDVPTPKRDLSKLRWRQPMPARGTDFWKRLNLPKRPQRVVPSDGRIIGGSEAEIGQFPHQAALFIDVFYFCGGELISNLYVLTAAHCTYGAYMIDIYLGSHNINLESEPNRLTLETNAENFIVHQGYDPYEIVNDISLIMLPRRITFTPYIQPIRLPTRTEALNRLEDLPVITSGWGRPSDTSSGISAVLRYTDLKVQPHVICRHFFSDLIKDSNICTDTRRGQGTCGGDSGGALVHKGSNGEYLVGVTSFGSSIACVEAGWPSVFTYVGSFLNWIRDNTDIVIEN